MSIATEIGRLQADKAKIKEKLIELGMATSLANLTALAEAIEALVNQGAVSVEVREGETYYIPEGYHNGSGSVKAVSGGGNYTLESKAPITPTKNQQHITASNGYYGLDAITILPIPDRYQDVSGVNVTEEQVLTGKIFVTSEGKQLAGTMTDNGAVSKVLHGTMISYTIPKGYHNGSGTVKIVLETKTVTPSKVGQDIIPTDGKVLSKVTVLPIPEKYQDVSEVTAKADKVLEDNVFVSATGEKVEGTMPDKGNVSKVLDANTPSYTIDEGYHNGSGIVSIALETKDVTPTKDTQDVTPAEGKVLSKVTVNPIPDEYVSTEDADAEARHIYEGKIAYVKGEKVEGTMKNLGGGEMPIDGLTQTEIVVGEGYTSGGRFFLTDDIENALAEI